MIHETYKHTTEPELKTQNIKIIRSTKTDQPVNIDLANNPQRPTVKSRLDNMERYERPETAKKSSKRNFAPLTPKPDDQGSDNTGPARINNLRTQTTTPGAKL